MCVTVYNWRSFRRWVRLEASEVIGFKECPRCKGDVQTAGDRFGEYAECLQCGHVAYVEKAIKDIAMAGGRGKAGRPRKRHGSRTAA